MPRAFLITNKRYNSFVDYEDSCWSRDDSPERDVFTAEGPLFIDDEEEDSRSCEESYKPSSPKSPAHESNGPSSPENNNPDSMPEPDSVQASVQVCVPTTPPRLSPPPLQQSPSTSTTQQCVISCYTNADLMSVIQQLMRQNPTFSRIPAATTASLSSPKNVKLSSDSHVCPECGKRYSTSSNLARHRQTHRSVTDKKARKCPHCEKVYVSMPAYSMHVRTHSQGCQCPYCGKCFSRPWLLQGHIRTHTGEKPFSCNVCRKAFADKSNLRAHIQTHSNSKPYLCERCGKAFALKSYLYKHEESSCMRIHKQDRSGTSSGLDTRNTPLVKVQ